MTNLPGQVSEMTESAIDVVRLDRNRRKLSNQCIHNFSLESIGWSIIRHPRSFVDVKSLEQNRMRCTSHHIGSLQRDSGLILQVGRHRVYATTPCITSCTKVTCHSGAETSIVMHLVGPYKGQYGEGTVLAQPYLLLLLLYYETKSLSPVREGPLCQERQPKSSH